MTKTLPSEESLCPHYGGIVHVFNEGFTHGDFLTINKQTKRVTWFGPFGYKVIRTFHLSKVPIHAVFCLCQLLGLPSSDEAPEKLLSVAILLSDFELEIHYANGEKHEVSLPIAVSRLIGTPYGLLLQAVSMQHRAAGMSIPLTSTFADLHQQLNEQTSQFLLIRSPQSSIESISQDNTSLRTDLDVVAVYEDMMLCHSANTQTLLLYKLRHAPETSHVQSEHSREQSNISMDKSALDPALSSSNNSSFLRNNNTTMQSSHTMHTALSGHSAQTAQSINTRSSNSSPRNRPSPLERGTSNTYDKETLQALLGERSTRVVSKMGIERSDRGARLSSGSFRSIRSNSPTKLSIPIDNDEIYMEGLDATLDTQSTLQLDCLLEMAAADWKGLEEIEDIQAEDMLNYHVEMVCHHVSVLVHYVYAFAYLFYF
ncbi:hypothetical protein EON65_09695 [archaeon]|nr:MAG: hypothetical protein EON65_09695 [archaeon]